MSSCTFFGHRDAPKKIESDLYFVLNELVKKHNVDSFYVGNNGNFDHIVRQQLAVLKRNYPHINYSVVLSHIPTRKDGQDYENTIYPDGLEKTPPKYAVCKRNEWMLKKSDYVVTYVVYSFGGAFKYKNMAERKNKTVINLPELTSIHNSG